MLVAWLLGSAMTNCHRPLPYYEPACSQQFLLVGADDNLVQLITPRLGVVLFQVAVHADYVRALAFTPSESLVETDSWCPMVVKRTDHLVTRRQEFCQCL
jgi:hypothetical protein